MKLKRTNYKVMGICGNESIERTIYVDGFNNMYIKYNKHPYRIVEGERGWVTGNRRFYAYWFWLDTDVVLEALNEYPVATAN